MRKTVLIAAAIGAAMTIGSPVAANPFNGARQIAAGNLPRAERAIVAQRALFPDQVDLSINLATIYLRTGRVAAARRMWATVAAQPDQEVVLADGTPAWSHQLAARALSQLTQQVASR